MRLRSKMNQAEARSPHRANAAGRRRRISRCASRLPALGDFRNFDCITSPQRDEPFAAIASMENCVDTIEPAAEPRLAARMALDFDLAIYAEQGPINIVARSVHRRTLGGGVKPALFCPIWTTSLSPAAPPCGDSDCSSTRRLLSPRIRTPSSVISTPRFFQFLNYRINIRCLPAHRLVATRFHSGKRRGINFRQ